MLDVAKVLADAGAVYTDQHFVYASGKHGSGYINMDPLFTDIELMQQPAELPSLMPYRTRFDMR